MGGCVRERNYLGVYEGMAEIRGYKTTVEDVILKSAGSPKINVIQGIRSLNGSGLKKTKYLIDSAPKTIKEGVSKTEAKKLKISLEEAGATVELK